MNEPDSTVTAFFAEADPPTPCLVLDLDLVEQLYGSLRRAMPYAEPFYAVKANPEPEVVGLLTALGSSFDVASPAEIDICLDQGAAPERLSYGNAVKKEAEIEYAYDRGIRMFAFDSARELTKLAEYAPGASVYCRLLAGSFDARWPLSDKFGCSPDFAVELMQDAAAAGLHPLGLSFHVGSQQTNPDRWEPSIVTAAKVFAALRDRGIELETLNIGGGYPAQYTEAIEPMTAYGDAIGDAVRRAFGPDTPRILSEPGRVLVADAGVLRTQVVSVRRPFDGGDWWVYLDAGKFGGLAETEGEAIQYRVVTRAGGVARPTVLAGPTCDSADIMYRDTKYDMPADLDVGDIVDFLSAGAYTASYSSVAFNGFPPLSTYCIRRQ